MEVYIFQNCRTVAVYIWVFIRFISKNHNLENENHDLENEVTSPEMKMSSKMKTRLSLLNS